MFKKILRVKQSKKNVDASQMPLIAHLVELRDRLIRALIGLVLVFLALTPFANDLYEMLAAPLMAQLPANTSMIATQVAAPFFAPFKLTLFVALFASMPWLLYQVWAFIAPGLYRHERKIMLPLLASSTLLFYLGAAFAYFVVFPLMFAFFTGTAPEGVAVMTDITSYLDFVLTIFFAFGVAFEVPIVVFVMVWMGMVSTDSLREKRPYIIVAAFVIGMLLTPPDVISQTLLAVPMILLFEAGLLVATMFERKRAAQPEENADEAVDLDEEFARAQEQERENSERGGTDDH